MELYSQRQQRLRGDQHDVFVYDELPDTVRVQIIHIWNDVLGNGNQYYESHLEVKQAYDFIVNKLCREYGLLSLSGVNRRNTTSFREELHIFMRSELDVERCLDAVELSFWVIEKFTKRYAYMHRQDGEKRAEIATAELNQRFQSKGIGYQYSDGKIIRVDSQYLHAEVVVPSLRLLSAAMYAGAQEEYLKAHEHYRHGRHKEALVDCLKSFESMMKIICTNRNWAYSHTATAKTLIQTCLDNGLIPKFWQEHYTSLRCLLESGIPTGRNKMGGHGQGDTRISVPDHMVAYMLHMTASALVFLAEADRSILHS
jgi:hypothetical protein